MNRSIAIARRLMLQLIFDRRALALVLVVPVLVMGILATVLDTGDDLPTIAIRATGPTELFVQDIADRLGNVSNPDDKLAVVSLDPALSPQEAIRQGLADAVMEFPPRFIEERVSGQASEVKLHVDGADPMKTADVASRLRASLSAALAGMPKLLPSDCQGHCGDTIPDAQPDVDVVRLYGDALDDAVDFYIPVLPPFFVFFFVFLISGMAFLNERTSGTAERLLASPLGRWELVLGYVLGYLPAALVQAAITIAFARWALGGPWGGWPVVVAVLLLALAAECLGVFVSAFARTEFQVVQFIPIVILPQLLLAGIFWPITELPGWLQPIAQALPLTWAVDAIRDTAIRGFPPSAVLPELGLLAGFVVLTVALAARSVRSAVR